ncbi:MAG: hypothetical protein QNJ63_00750 [Calothrix sp. MO_192.B10]|nr:hypothetical protein [Calothrix sp. MO_192.B10]
MKAIAPVEYGIYDRTNILITSVGDDLSVSVVISIMEISEKLHSS